MCVRARYVFTSHLYLCLFILSTLGSGAGGAGGSGGAAAAAGNAAALAAVVAANNAAAAAAAAGGKDRRHLNGQINAVRQHPYTRT